MAKVRLAGTTQRHVECPTREIASDKVPDRYFQDNERARGYVLDEQDESKKSIDGELIRDRDLLSDAVGPQSIINVIQALSGG